MASRKNQGRASSDSRNTMRKEAPDKVSARARTDSGESLNAERKSTGGPRRISMPKNSRPRPSGNRGANRPVSAASSQPRIQTQEETDRILNYYAQHDSERRRRAEGEERSASMRSSSNARSGSDKTGKTKQKKRKAQSPQERRQARKTSSSTSKGNRAGVDLNPASNRKVGTARKAEAGRKDEAARKAEPGRKGEAGASVAASAGSKSRTKARASVSKTTKPQSQGSLAMTRILIVCIVVAVLGIGCSLLYMAPIFPIKEVTVEGAEHLTNADVVKIADIPEGTTMLQVSANDVEQRLEESPWVESASVSRELPGTLKVTVKEEKMAAVVNIVSTETNKEELWELDSDANWLMLIPDEGSDEAENVPDSVYADLENVLTISDVPKGPKPVAGAKCTDATILNAFDIVSGLTTELSDMVVQVSAPDCYSTSLTLEDGIEIAFGEASDIRTKERICLKLMEDYPDQIAYINVRVVDRPTYRTYY